MQTATIVPNAPNEEGVDGQAVLEEVFMEVEDGVVVEGYGNTDVVQAGGIALEVFDGIGVGVEDVGVVTDFARERGCVLKKMRTVRQKYTSS